MYIYIYYARMKPHQMTNLVRHPKIRVMNFILANLQIQKSSAPRSNVAPTTSSCSMVRPGCVAVASACLILCFKKTSWLWDFVCWYSSKNSYPEIPIQPLTNPMNSQFLRSSLVPLKPIIWRTRWTQPTSFERRHEAQSNDWWFTLKSCISFHCAWISYNCTFYSHHLFLKYPFPFYGVPRYPM